MQPKAAWGPHFLDKEKSSFWLKYGAHMDIARAVHLMQIKDWTYANIIHDPRYVN